MKQLKQFDLEAEQDRPTKIVCLCGSTRFAEEIDRANEQFTMQGHIVLAPGVFFHSTGRILDSNEKARLDVLHLKKIDMADLVYIVNPRGYIGESTGHEIEYAYKQGKQVGFLERCRWFPDGRVF